jgi:uncharacterized membrane protein YeaQ/YmgE (transglycosylase-associated protein family)
MGHKLSQSCDWLGAKPARRQQNKPEKTSAGNRTKGVNSMEQIIIQLISGAVGGNVIGKVMKNLDLGTLGNSLAGIVGGGLGGQLLGMMGAGGGEAAAGGWCWRWCADGRDRRCEKDDGQGLNWPGAGEKNPRPHLWLA